ncbi:MAG: hypothetical protein H0U97_12840 [Gammaproteobacteria bacterium]|nr:hypothetical protein [Gammaproteobacteria bacterium]
MTPAPDMLRVFAEGAAAAAEQGSAVARLAPGSRARIAGAQGVAASTVPEQMGRLKVPVSVSGNPRPEQLSALRDALTGAGARVIVNRGAGRQRPSGTTVGEARARRCDWRRAVLWGRHDAGDRDDDLRLRRQGGGLRT